MANIEEKVRSGKLLLKQEGIWAANNFESEELLLLLCRYELTSQLFSLIARKIFTHKNFITIKVSYKSYEILKIVNERGSIFDYESVYKILPHLPLPERFNYPEGAILTFYFLLNEKEAVIPEQDFAVE